MASWALSKMALVPMTPAPTVCLVRRAQKMSSRAFSAMVIWVALISPRVVGPH